ncbi:MAG: amidase [Bacteroidales bacterium]|nr:amidase [Bacteroidales bacterium]
MKRRNFFKSTVLGAGAFALAPIQSCQPPDKKKQGSAADFSSFDLNETTINILQEKMHSGKLTSEAITKKYLNRIEEIDNVGPTLRAVIELNPDALEIARQLDEERKAGKVRGPLHGIPVMIKDNIDTGDRMQTTAGSLALEGFIAPEDAFIVKQLRTAGAVLLGKTNLSEWANFRSFYSSSGWCGRGGQVRNPYMLDRTPCGSSSGSGAATAANLCTLTIGTETNGSIVCPSGINGIVGIKPTVGLWSRQGIIPISHTQDTAGPMARTVKDAAILLGAITGVDTNDTSTEASAGNFFTDYTAFLDPNGLAGARIGVARDFLGFHPLVDQLFEEALEAMKAKGAEIIDPVKFEGMGKLGGYEINLLMYEFKHGLNKYLEERPNTPVKNLEEIITFNEKNSDLEMPWFGQDVFIEAQKKGSLDSEEYLEALNNALEITGKKGIDALTEQHNLDAIIGPTNGPAWNIDWVNGDHFGGGSSSPAAISGYPAITVPAGFVHGLPVGISFFGKAWSEPVLLKLAFAFEQATLHRKAPEFLGSLMG